MSEELKAEIAKELESTTQLLQKVGAPYHLGLWHC